MAIMRSKLFNNLLPDLAVDRAVDFLHLAFSPVFHWLAFRDTVCGHVPLTFLAFLILPMMVFTMNITKNTYWYQKKLHY